jgi:hypothetical protein
MNKEREANYWQRFCHRRQRGRYFFVKVKVTRKRIIFDVKERNLEVEA